MESTSQTPLVTDVTPGEALSVKRFFTAVGEDPFDTVEWELRDARIAHGGKVAFEQRGVEFPKTWSQNATNIVAQKYFRGQLGTPAREHSVRQMVGRVSATIADWGRSRGYFASVEDGDTFQAELAYVLLHQMAAFNSPVWFNVGFEESPQCSACQPYGALISTPDGMVQIGEFVAGDQIGREVYDANGVTRIVATKANGVKQAYRVQLHNGSFVDATADHVVKAVRERLTEPQWLRVDELEVGMRMHLHPHRAKVGERALVAASGAVTVEDDGLAPVDPVKVSEAALAGWLQSAGSVADGGAELVIEFTIANDDEHAWVLEHLDRALPEVSATTLDVESEDDALALRRIRLQGGEALRDFVERWSLLARGAARAVPYQLWTASHEEIAAYLRSIFQADGHVSIRRESGYEGARIGFAVTAERWTEDIQILLGVLGIYSSRTRKVQERDDRHDLHEVAIAIGSERARFAELVGFVDARKQGKLLASLDLRKPKRCPDLREEEIVAIEPLGEMDVYDIQTESDEYLCNNIAVHNCFILSVQDEMDSILDWNTKEGKIFLGGSGSGINLSNIRGSMEPLTKGGTASGPVSFMRGADSWAGTIKSGGKTRRAAKMVVLDVDHPDIRDFIWCKAREEKKAAALRDAGFDMSIDGEGFHSIQYQNANNSVRLTDDFMRAVEQDKDWHLIARTTGQPVGDPIPARELMREIADAAWQCADPGVQYDTTINRWHTCPVSGRINASNPCSEYMHVDDSACNLASLNLMKYRRPDGTFDVESYMHVVDVMFLAQEIVVGPSSYPTEEIGVNARAFRQLGLGYANLGAFLMSNGMAYDSDGGRATAAAITSLMTGRAYLGSARIAAAIGPYERYAENRDAHNAVVRMHRDASHAIPDAACSDTALLKASRRVWDEAVTTGEAHGYRNAQASVIAPTGTISFLMDCDTTGIEPDFSLVKFKELVGGGQMTIVNQTISMALRTLGYTDEQIEQIEAYVNEHATIVGAPYLTAEHFSVFDVAVGERAISHMGHIKMMGAVQPFISGAISKTVNLPHEATIEDIADAYLRAWHLGIKALAIYRDGSKTAQALRTDAHEGKSASSAGYSQEQVDALVAEAKAATRKATLSEVGPKRNRMPRERHSITHKFSIAGHEGYITAGMYEDGTVGEIFLTDIGKEGSTLRGMMNAFATSISIALQYGVPLETLVQKFSYMRFEPEGITQNPEIPFAKSMPDYIMRWLASRFLDTDTQEELGILTPEVRARKMAEDAATAAAFSDTAGPSNGGNGTAKHGPAHGPMGTVAGTAPATTRAAAEALTDTPPVVPVRMKGLDLGPACSQCGGMMQRTGSCYTCPSCGNNTGCG
ncbi:MAG: ribonucleoside-diphosphate reductase alpha chain [Solirubrobacteraceae bacterium]|jgi:ribonucleoside-diphosphate reductase alpha chain|nr:ribonucleoside-diphosphate reductase alpha chain [Solirubrobacteraceae bacterium]